MVRWVPNPPPSSGGYTYTTPFPAGRVLQSRSPINLKILPLPNQQSTALLYAPRALKGGALKGGGAEGGGAEGGGALKGGALKGRALKGGGAEGGGC